MSSILNRVLSENLCIERASSLNNAGFWPWDAVDLANLPAQVIPTTPLGMFEVFFTCELHFLFRGKQVGADLTVHDFTVDDKQTTVFI